MQFTIRKIEQKDVDAVYKLLIELGGEKLNDLDIYCLAVDNLTPAI